MTDNNQLEQQRANEAAEVNAATQIKDLICQALSEKKAYNITVLKVNHLTILADYFVICSAKSTTQVKALGENVEKVLAENGLEPQHKDGYTEGRWVALDYGSVIAHIFHDETRVLYALEQLWNDGANMEKYEG